MKREFGLVGFPLTHSFSQHFFIKKIIENNIQNVDYQLFPIKNIHLLTDLLQNNHFLNGLNVTSPYKTSILPFLNEIDTIAELIGAVNVITIERNGKELKLKGFNTDYIGFGESYDRCEQLHRNALVLGSGGAARAVGFALEKRNISYQFVSRDKNFKNLSYNDLTPDLVNETTLIVNATPVGMGELIEQKPSLPYHAIGTKHLLFDLIYNPAETLFLQEGKRAGATIKNGLEMLGIQAEENWKLWNIKKMSI